MWEQMQQWMEQLSQTEDDAVRRDLQEKVAVGLMQTLPEYDLAVLDLYFINGFRNYDPARGKFEHYTRAVLKKIREKQKRKEEKWAQNISLNTSISEENETKWIDLQEDRSLPALEDRLMAEETAAQLIAIILQLPQRLRGQANNPDKINYYRLFFTDGMAQAILENGEEIYIAHERDLFKAMKLPFLDFFMAEICRSVHEIYIGQLKPYGAMIKGMPMSEPRLVHGHLPYDIYLAYLKEVENRQKTDSTLSNQRAAYNKLREQLC